MERISHVKIKNCNHSSKAATATGTEGKINDVSSGVITKPLIGNINDDNDCDASAYTEFLLVDCPRTPH